MRRTSCYVNVLKPLYNSSYDYCVCMSEALEILAVQIIFRKAIFEEKKYNVSDILLSVFTCI